MMRNIGTNKRKIWFGVHQELGGILYDENMQLGIKKDRVRIFLLNDYKTSNFIKTILREKLNKIDNELIKKYEKSINVYLKIINKVANKRETHCYNCKENINSIDFELCIECNWILCDCGSCGCAWQESNV